jgi:hypothetical protein
MGGWWRPRSQVGMTGRRRLIDIGTAGGRRLRCGSGYRFGSDRRGLLRGRLRPAPARRLPTPGRPLAGPGRPSLGQSRLTLDQLRRVRRRLRWPPARLRLPYGRRRLGSRLRAVRAVSGTPPDSNGAAGPGVAPGPRTRLALRFPTQPLLHRFGRCGRGNPGLRLERGRRRTRPPGVGSVPGRRGRWRPPASRMCRSGVLPGRGRDRPADGRLPASGGRIGPGVGAVVAGRPRRRLGSTVSGTRWRSGLAGSVGREPAGQRRGRARLLRAGLRRRLRS